jgi:hypothetical protein
MAIDPIFDTNVLVHVVRNLKLPSQFLLDMFFPNAVEYETEYVSIDVDVGLRRMAPFVSPLVEGKPVEGRKWQTNTFKPAYIKDLRTPDFRRPVLRAIGEKIAGNLTPAERVMQNLAFEMEDQVQMVQRRLEWMAAQALMSGTVTITGDGFEPVTVNFNRDAALTVDISTGGTNAPWLTAATVAALGTSGAVTYVTPSTDIEVWNRTILQKSGRAGDVVIFSSGAWELFLLDTRVQQSVWYQRSGDSEVNFGGTPPVQGAVFKGRWSGYQLWVYNDWYIDSSGTEQPMLTDNYVLMGSTAMEGVRAFGVILDEDFNFGALAYAPKTWVEKNPSRRHILMQSAPIVIPARVNAALSAKVA